jgi:hypothetical protein
MSGAQPVVSFLVAALLTSGCIEPASLRVAPSQALPYKPGKLRLRVETPLDRRPAVEIEGDSDSTVYWVFYGLGVVIASRGSQLTSTAHYQEQAWSQLHQSLIDQLRSARVFSEVSQQGPGDYVLETEVLHLVSSFYRAYAGQAHFGVMVARTQAFMPHATVTLRLRLKRHDGTLVATRVVRGSFLGGPGYTHYNHGLVTREALANVLVEARTLVASWIFDLESPRAVAVLEAEHERAHAQGHRFYVHAVSPDRSGVVFTTIDCPSGAMGPKFQRSGIPIVGQPSQWLLSPYDAHGVRYSTAAYSALSRHLARHFVLHRFDQLGVYHYLGRRLAAPVVAGQP